MDGHLIRFDEDKTFVFIDCETENLCLNSFNNLPWQIAMIKALKEFRPTTVTAEKGVDNALKIRDQFI